MVTLCTSNDGFDASTGVDGQHKPESLVNLTGDRRAVLWIAHVLLALGVGLLGAILVPLVRGNSLSCTREYSLYTSSAHVYSRHRMCGGSYTQMPASLCWQCMPTHANTCKQHQHTSHRAITERSTCSQRPLPAAMCTKAPPFDWGTWVSANPSVLLPLGRWPRLRFIWHMHGRWHRCRLRCGGRGRLWASRRRRFCFAVTFTRLRVTVRLGKCRHSCDWGTRQQPRCVVVV